MTCEDRKDENSVCSFLYDFISKKDAGDITNLVLFSTPVASQNKSRHSVHRLQKLEVLHLSTFFQYVVKATTNMSNWSIVYYILK